MTAKFGKAGIGKLHGAIAASLLACLPLGAPAALAQASQQEASKPPAQAKGQEGQSPKAEAVTDQDKNFATKAAENGVTQVLLSSVAAERIDDPKVKNFARDSVENVDKANHTLRAIASDLALYLPQTPPDEAKKLERFLAFDQGLLFDGKYYLTQMAAASAAAVDLFKGEAEKGGNPRLVQFAQQTLPELQQRQAQANQLSHEAASARQAQQNQTSPASATSPSKQSP